MWCKCLFLQLNKQSNSNILIESDRDLRNKVAFQIGVLHSLPLYSHVDHGWAAQGLSDEGFHVRETDGRDYFNAEINIYML